MSQVLKRIVEDLVINSSSFAFVSSSIRSPAIYKLQIV